MPPNDCERFFKLCLQSVHPPLLEGKGEVDILQAPAHKRKGGGVTREAQAHGFSCGGEGGSLLASEEAAEGAGGELEGWEGSERHIAALKEGEGGGG